MADRKVSELTNLAAPAATDLVYVVHDPSGTPVPRQSTVAQLLGTTLALTGGTLSGLLEVDDAIQLGSNASAMQLSDQAGTNGRRLRLSSKTQPAGTKSAQLEIVPDANVDHANVCASQILLYNVPGADYERLGISCVNDQFVIDSTVQGAGTLRNMYFKAGNVSGLTILSDASVDLNGSSGATRARVADPENLGRSQLVIDTRTTTPANNAADYAYIDFRRGGAGKWQIGLNYNGANQDNLDFYSGGLVFSLGAAKIGFFGTAPQSKPTGVAVTAGGIHAALVTLGLIAA